MQAVLQWADVNFASVVSRNLWLLDQRDWRHQSLYSTAIISCKNRAFNHHLTNQTFVLCVSVRTCTRIWHCPRNSTAGYRSVTIHDLLKHSFTQRSARWFHVPKRGKADALRIKARIRKKQQCIRVQIHTESSSAVSVVSHRMLKLVMHWNYSNKKNAYIYIYICICVCYLYLSILVIVTVVVMLSFRFLLNFSFI